MSSLAHLKNGRGVVVYSEMLRQMVQLARQKHFEDLTTEEWCEGIDMPIECYATKVLMGVAPLTFKDIKGICTFCGTPAKELLDSVAGLGKDVEEQGITFIGGSQVLIEQLTQYNNVDIMPTMKIANLLFVIGDWLT